jgi:YfiR/HmsC-like
VLLLKIARGIQWPNETQSKSFVIGVLSYTPLADELKNSVATIKKGKLPIVIRELSSPDECDDCDVLFLPSFKSKSLPAVLSRIGNNSTLVVTNKFNLTREGSGINFILQEGKIKYEINPGAIEKRGMRISADIRNMGSVLQ